MRSFWLWLPHEVSPQRVEQPDDQAAAERRPRTEHEDDHYRLAIERRQEGNTERDDRREDRRSDECGCRHLAPREAVGHEEMTRPLRAEREHGPGRHEHRQLGEPEAR